MTVSPFDSAFYGPLFSDDEVAHQFSDVEAVRAMVQVERALARAQGRVGVIPEAAASIIDQTLNSFEPDLAALGAGTASAGVPVPALVAQLRQAVGGDAADYVHWGATSQDIIDTALVLRLRSVLENLAGRLDWLVARLADLADAHRKTVMVARTRSQHAIPTVFGLTLAGWLMPLVRHRERLAELRPRLHTVQFGCAAGTLAALGDNGAEVVNAFAEELDLNVPPTAWHTQRDTIAELAGWLSLVSGSLGKMAQDLVLLGQTEIAEVRAEEAGGGSSTLPQKANPVRAETMIALARTNAALLTGVHQAMIQEHERGGAGWSVEWLTLPQMAAATASALRHAEVLADGLRVDATRMTANLSASNGFVLAEAITFALARHMSRAEAEALIKAACKDARDESRPLIDIVREKTGFPLDWEALADPSNYLGSADRLIDQVLAAARNAAR